MTTKLWSTSMACTAGIDRSSALRALTPLIITDSSYCWKAAVARTAKKGLLSLGTRSYRLFSCSRDSGLSGPRYQSTSGSLGRTETLLPSQLARFYLLGPILQISPHTIIQAASAMEAVEVQNFRGLIILNSWFLSQLSPNFLLDSYASFC